MKTSFCKREVLKSLLPVQHLTWAKIEAIMGDNFTRAFYSSNKLCTWSWIKEVVVDQSTRVHLTQDRNGWAEQNELLKQQIFKSTLYTRSSCFKEKKLKTLIRARRFATYCCKNLSHCCKFMASRLQRSSNSGDIVPN